MWNFTKMLIQNTIIAVLLYTGLFMDIEWAGNVGLFIVWFFIIAGWILILLLGIFLSADDSHFKRNISDKNPSFLKVSLTSKIVSRAFVIVNICMLVASGYFVTGALWAINTIVLIAVLQAVRDKADRLGGVGDATKA